MYSLFHCVRRLGETGLLEHVGLVEQHRRIDRVRDAELAFAAGVVQVDGRLGELAHVEAGLVDVRLQVEPLAVERLRATDPDRADDVGAVAGRQLRGERVAGALVDEPFELEMDALVRGVEVLGHLELHFDLLGGVTRPETAVPADHDIARVRLRARDRQRRRDRLGRFRGSPRRRQIPPGAADPVGATALGVAPPQAPASRASTDTRTAIRPNVGCMRVLLRLRRPFDGLLDVVTDSLLLLV